MTQELTLYQIIAGKVACKILGDLLYVKSPTPEQKLMGLQIYQDTLLEAELDGVLTDTEMQTIMIQNGLWSPTEESELSTASTRMDTLKEEMYKRYSSFQSQQIERLRRLLIGLRTRAGELFKKKHAYDLYTCVGLATVYQLQTFLANNTYDSNGTVISEKNIDDTYMRLLSEQYVNNKPTDFDVRQITKSGLWRSIWHASKGDNSIFGLPATFFSDEQRSLIGWSRLYDNIAEAVEQPDKIVLDDDDLLDGWLILQYKQRESERMKKPNDSLNIQGGAQEVFIPVETIDDARRVAGMNDLASQMLKRQRLNLIQKQGRVEEQDMPDSQQEMIMEATRKFNEQIRNQ